MERMQNMSADALRQMAKNLSYQELVNLCGTEQRLNRLLCQDDRVWTYLLQRDYPLSPPLPGVSPRLAYNLNRRQTTSFLFRANGTFVSLGSQEHHPLDADLFILELRGLRPQAGTRIFVSLIQDDKSTCAEAYRSKKHFMGQFKTKNLREYIMKAGPGYDQASTFLNVLVDHLAFPRDFESNEELIEKIQMQAQNLKFGARIKVGVYGAPSPEFRLLGIVLP